MRLALSLYVYEIIPVEIKDARDKRLAESSTVYLFLKDSSIRPHLRRYRYTGKWSEYPP